MVVVGQQELVGLDPEDGRMLWRHPHPNELGLNLSMPVWGPDGLLFMSSAYDGGSRVIRLSQIDGRTTADEVWATNRMRVHFSNGGIHLTAPGGRIAVCLGPECTTRGTTPRCVHGFPTMPRVGTIWTGCAGLRVSDARPVTVRRAGSWAAESAVVRTVVGGCPAQPAPSSRHSHAAHRVSPQPGH